MADLPLEYHHPTDFDIKCFLEICPGRVFTGNEIKKNYARDEIKIYGVHMPDVVIEAASTEEVSRILAYCNIRRIAVTPRGAGSGLCSGCVAVYGGVVLSLSSMNKIIEIDKNNLTITVEAGILLTNLIEILESENLFYPLDPGEKSATIGGNIMTNTCGMRAVKYGVIRDYVGSLTIVLADGSVVELGGKLAKNPFSYSIKDLLIGSEGTLGIVTKAQLKVLPKPGVTYAGLVPFSSVEKAISVVPEIIAFGLNLTAIEFMQKEVVSLTKEYLGKTFPHIKAPVYLLVSMEADNDDCAFEEMNNFAQLVVELGAEDVFFADTDDHRDYLCVPRGAFLEAIKSSAIDMDECDVVIPIDAIPDFVAFIGEIASKYNTRINYFGHPGNGNLHIYCCYDGGDKSYWLNLCKTIMEDLCKKADQLGGQVSGERGIGHDKINYLEQYLPKSQLKLIKGIKQAFDPNSILNPGKIV